jgi:hypothetical protein
VPTDLDALNPYARPLADEALRRGIRVEVTDAAFGELRLSLGGRSVCTRESLPELTSAVAMSRCDDKRVTRRIMARAGVRVPRAVEGDTTAARGLLEHCGEVVVEPARGEQGKASRSGCGTLGSWRTRWRWPCGTARTSSSRSSSPGRTCGSS